MKIFLDSSVIIAALISESGGSAQIIKLCEAGYFECWISPYVVSEIEKVIQRKFPELQKTFEALLKTQSSRREKILKITKKTSPALIKKAEKWIQDKNDAPILAAAREINVESLLTLDIRHFITDKKVSEKSGLNIQTPGTFLQNLVQRNL